MERVTNGAINNVLIVYCVVYAYFFLLYLSLSILSCNNINLDRI